MNGHRVYRIPNGVLNAIHLTGIKTARMKPMKINAADYPTRKQLDNFVASKIGMDAEKNRIHKIVGTDEELRQLGLSPGKTVYGIECEIIKSIKKKKK